MAETIAELLWYFRIGWILVAQWVGDGDIEETWIHKKTGERRIVRR